MRAGYVGRMSAGVGSGFSLKKINNLSLWLDSSDSTTITSAYRSLVSTVTGTSGQPTLVCLGDESDHVFSGMSIRVNGVDVYTVQSVATSLGVTTITVVGTLSTGYAAKALATFGVSQWNDKSGFGNNATQGTAASQFSIVPNSQNGKAGLLIDSTDDIMQVSSLVPNWNGINFTVFAVAKMLATDDAFRGLIGNRFGAGSANWWTLGRSADSDDMAVEIGDAGNVNYVNTGVDPIGAGTEIFTFQKSSTNGIIYLNNVLKETYNASANNFGGATNTLSIGRWLVDTQGWGGLIYEAIIYTRALTTAEIAQVNRYLSNKWGVAIS